MPQYAPFVKETTTTTGTGTITLAGAATGFNTFILGGITDGQTVDYGLHDNNGGKEEGRGVYSTGTLTRDTVFGSTNGGAKINLSGIAEVFITISSYEMTYLPAKISARASLRI